MSVQTAITFLKAVDSDNSLAAIIKGKNIDEVVVIAAQHGYSVTVESIREASDELYGDLSEEELSKVAGGTLRNNRL